MTDYAIEAQQVERAGRLVLIIVNAADEVHASQQLIEAWRRPPSVRGYPVINDEVVTMGLPDEGIGVVRYRITGRSAQVETTTYGDLPGRTFFDTGRMILERIYDDT